MSPLAREQERINGFPTCPPIVPGFEGVKKPSKHPNRYLLRSMCDYQKTSHNRILGDLYRLRHHLVKQLEARHKHGLKVWRDGLSFGGETVDRPLQKGASSYLRIQMPHEMHSPRRRGTRDRYGDRYDLNEETADDLLSRHEGAASFLDQIRLADPLRERSTSLDSAGRPKALPKIAKTSKKVVISHHVTPYDTAGVTTAREGNEPNFLKHSNVNPQKSKDQARSPPVRSARHSKLTKQNSNESVGSKRKTPLMKVSIRGASQVSSRASDYSADQKKKVLVINQKERVDGSKVRHVKPPNDVTLMTEEDEFMKTLRLNAEQNILMSSRTPQREVGKLEDGFLKAFTEELNVTRKARNLRYDATILQHSPQLVKHAAQPSPPSKQDSTPFSHSAVRDPPHLRRPSKQFRATQQKFNTNNVELMEILRTISKGNTGSSRPHLVRHAT